MKPAAVVVVAAVAGAHALHGQTQEPPPVFRVQVDAVELDVFVADARGNPVTDLSIDDFEVLEDGRRQRIATFAFVDVPIQPVEQTSPREIEPDIGTNQHPEGRIYLIAIDEIPEALALRTRVFLRRFIEQHFARNDVAALVYVGRGQSANTQGFTGSRRLLLEAVEKVGGGFPADTTPGFETESGAERDWRARMRTRSLRELTESIARIRGRRKAMLLITTGLDIDVFEALDYTGGIKSIAFDDLHGAVTAATRGNVAIYPIDPAGLTPGGDTTLEIAQGLRALASATGGFALVNSNSVDQTFGRIVQENSSYYVLGFSSTNERRDGRFRSIDVRVKRPGLRVRARAGYVAPRGAGRREGPPPIAELSPEASEALRSPLPGGSVPIRVFAAPYKTSGRDASVTVAIEVDAASLGLVEMAGERSGELEVGFMGTDAKGKVYRGAYHLARLSLKPESYAQGAVRLVDEMRLPPGRYQVRVVAGNRAGQAGSVVHDVNVPDFTEGPLVLSGVSVLSASAPTMATARLDDGVRGRRPGPVTATRSFASDDRLTLYFEVYEPEGQQSIVDVAVELRDERGAVVQAVSEQRTPIDADERTGGYTFTPALSLDDLPGGRYVIHVEARSDQADRPAASHDIPIRVR
jgi:VWFA-related protein